MRTHVDELIDPALLAEMVAERYVNTQTDESGELTIWNYGQRAQFDSVWNDATISCRGLITNKLGEVVARPFRKFFNLSQLATLPDGPFVASQKMDGSLGIVYIAADGMPAVATRGSFQSDQALWATAWLRSSPQPFMWTRAELYAGRTPLFEIIYPANRIVVDYGDRAELVYLTSIDIGSGQDCRQSDWPGSSAELHAGLDLEAVLAMETPNSEGFVLQWACGTRAKVKFAEYVRLHKLLTGVNTRTIWELLSTNTPLDDLVELVPDEFHQWVTTTVQTLTEQYSNIEGVASETLRTLDLSAPRRDIAAIVTRSEYPGIVFAMIDGKSYQERIWRLVYPDAGRPFMDDEV